jgi:predicted Zn-dependent protease
LVACVGCSAADIAGNAAGGLVGGGRAGEIARAAVSGAADTVQQLNVAFSPEQEYYLGRSVAATAIARYGLDPDERRQDYVRKVGAAIVALSDRLPATYGGYHFAVLDTDLENGLSGPGGFVMVTRGALLRCRSEDELAGILAHELAHVSFKHGEGVIRASPGWQSNIGTLFKVVGAAANANDQSVAPNMTQLLSDTARDLVKSLAEQGYGKEAEFQADHEGSLILYSVGYDGAAVREYLSASEGRMAKSWESHPEAAERIASLDKLAAEYGGGFDGGVGREARAKRWAAFLAGQPVGTVIAPAGEAPPAGPVETAPR